jgi:hypothetical protein
VWAKCSVFYPQAGSTDLSKTLVRSAFCAVPVSFLYALQLFVVFALGYGPTSTYSSKCRCAIRSFVEMYWMVTTLRFGRPEYRVSKLEGAKILLLLLVYRPPLGPTQPHIPVGVGELSSVVKRPDLEDVS